MINFNRIITVFALLCLFSNNVMADCDSTAGTHFPGVVPPNYEGNSATDSFNCAIHGTKQLTLEQVNERNSLIPISLSNRFYIMLGGNIAAEGITNAKNETTHVPYNNYSTLQVGTLSNKKIKVASNNFEIGFGYVWKDFAFDIEWLALKSVTFTSAENNVTPTFTFTSKLTGDTLLTNTYWFFNDMYNIKIYAVFSVGIIHNQSLTQIGSGPITRMNRYFPDGGLGIGARFNLVSKLFADVAGRFLVLGAVRMSANNGVESVYVDAYRTWLGASVRLLWLF